MPCPNIARINTKWIDRFRAEVEQKHHGFCIQKKLPKKKQGNTCEHLCCNNAK